ncbi:MAG: divalent-cation tolerance protein CutA [Roseinatronobacter sp.]|jgi:periplasmic divalent cation tolerance protein|nr:divalent-cation tolerance protein CutA [Roseinatronobacter sp.]
MEADMELLEVEVTCPDKDSARAIASACLKARLIACANLLPKVESLFCWQGQIDSETEVLLRMKTPRPNFEAVCTRIRSHHPYDLPAIIALPIAALGPGVSEWVIQELQAAKICD